ncbi:putative 1-acylglycerol-3-phosphate O-acyltransferase [Drosera capensis]
MRLLSRPRYLATMGEEIATNAASAETAAGKTTAKSRWLSLLRWIPTSTDHIIAAEKRILSLVRTPYVQEQVNIGSGPPGSKIRWFRSTSNEPRFINTVTFASAADSPTLVMVHGYGASQGFFFRNFDTLASKFRVIAMDQLGWGGSSRPDFTCKSTEETEAWFIDSFEEWRKAKNLSNFILLGHSFGGYIAAKYAIKHPEHVKHLILVGPAGFSAETDMSERLMQLRATWKGAIVNHLWESNFTPQKIIRGLGPWGPGMVRRYTSARFGSYSSGDMLNEDESKLLTDYVYHTLAAKGSGELCLKYIFSFGAFTRKPLLHMSVVESRSLTLYLICSVTSVFPAVIENIVSGTLVSTKCLLVFGCSASEWKVPTTFMYGTDDWMNYQGAQEARKQMEVPCEIIRVPQGGHFVFIDNQKGFHAAVFYACRRFLSPDPDHESLPEGLTSV